MNHIYSVLWNAALGRFCVVSELARSRSRAVKRSAARAGRHTPSPRLTTLAALLILMGSAPGWAGSNLPDGEVVKHGEATFGLTDKNTHKVITQTSPRLILEWNDFNVGRDHQVTFRQPDSTSVALNRVVGTNASHIHGQLKANGTVFLVNPNGVLFGKHAQVNVGILVASTLDISDNNFLRNRYKFQGSGGNIDNQGKITAADGGAVLLLGGSVTNHGIVTARLGTVALAAGNRVLVDVSEDGSLFIDVNRPALQAQVANHGMLLADGGSVWMTASATDSLLQTVINNTGHIRARTLDNDSGIIRLWTAGSGASAQNSGSLDVSAAQGDAGVIGISASHIQIHQDTKIDLSAQQGSRGGLKAKLGMGDLVVTDTGSTASVHQVTAGSALPDSQIAVRALSSALDTGDVQLMTDEGSIRIDAPVNWQQNLLWLDAAKDINVENVMTAGGTAELDMSHGGYDADTDTRASPASGVNMAMSTDGFVGRVDFTDVLDQSQQANRRLTINGESYQLMTEIAGRERLSVLRPLNTPPSAIKRLQDITDLSGRYALAADVVFPEEKSFRPIGTASEPFTGKFDGLGHKISNLVIKTPVAGDRPTALFGVSKGSVRNLELEAGKSHARTFPSDVVAASFVGELQDGGSITNVRSSLEVRASANARNASATAGGIVGKMTAGNVTNAQVHGAVTASAIGEGGNAKSVAGGIAGELQNGTITNAQVNAAVTGSAQASGRSWQNVTAQSFVGGAVGLNESGVLVNVTATGDVQDKSSGRTHVSAHHSIGNSPDATMGLAMELRAAQTAQGNHNAFIAAPKPLASLTPAGIRAVEQVPDAPYMPAMPTHAMVEAAPVTAVIAPVEISVPAAQTPSPVIAPLDLSARAANRPAAPINAARVAAPSPEISPVAAPLDLPARIATPLVTRVNSTVQAAPVAQASPETAAVKVSTPAAQIPAPDIVPLELRAHVPSLPGTPVSASIEAAPSPEIISVPTPVEISVPPAQTPSPATAPLELTATAAAQRMPGTPADSALEPPPAADAGVTSDRTATGSAASGHGAPGSVTQPTSIPATANATAQPSGNAQLAPGQPAPKAAVIRTDPVRKLQSLPGYAGAMATIGSMTRRAPAAATEPVAQDLPYTVIDKGVRQPLR